MENYSRRYELWMKDAYYNLVSNIGDRESTRHFRAYSRKVLFYFRWKRKFSFRMDRAIRTSTLRLTLASNFSTPSRVDARILQSCDSFTIAGVISLDRGLSRALFNLLSSPVSREAEKGTRRNAFRKRFISREISSGNIEPLREILSS